MARIWRNAWLFRPCPARNKFTDTAPPSRLSKLPFHALAAFQGRSKKNKKQKTKKKKKKSPQFYKQQQRRLENEATKKAAREFGYEISRIIKHHFHDFYEKLGNAIDPRQCGHYGIDEILFGGISLFLFKCGSRNSYDNLMNENKFRKNFQKAFGLRLPKLDTVAKVLKKMDGQELVKIKEGLVKELIEKRVFDKFRFHGKLLVAIDGTGLHTFGKRHCEHCCVKSYMNGKKLWFHHVLEAKIVAANGFSISICTEWIENPGELYKKQDCERKAMVRMADKLKQSFPRTAICILADGLYPNNTFFEKCGSFGWNYIVTLKEGNLKTLWQRIKLTNRDFLHHQYENGATSILHVQEIQWINNIRFKDRFHHWIQLDEKQINQSGKTLTYKFVYLTDIPIAHDDAQQLCETGRLRWKIEKQGFDQQKNHGYNISHKYCRKSYTGMKNFYQCCQIAHMINQLVELTKEFKNRLSNSKGKVTIKHIWFSLWAFMIYGDIQENVVSAMHSHRYQVQYVIT